MAGDVMSAISETVVGVTAKTLAWARSSTTARTRNRAERIRGSNRRAVVMGRRCSRPSEEPMKTPRRLRRPSEDLHGGWTTFLATTSAEDFHARRGTHADQLE